MRILLINGNTSAAVTERVAVEARRVAAPGTEIVAATACFGSSLILSRVESLIAGHAVVSALALHGTGCDAAVVAVSTDTGLAAAREIARMPVIGMTEAAVLTACMQGGRFGLLVFGRRALPVFEELVASYRVTARMAAAHALELTSADFMDSERIIAAILGGVDVLVRQHGAECVVVTGATMAGMSNRLQQQAPVPLVDGIACGVMQAELLVRLGLPKPTVGSYAVPTRTMLSGVEPALAELLAQPSVPPRA